VAFKDFFYYLWQVVAREFSDSHCGILLDEAVKHCINNHECAATIKKWMENAVDDAVEFSLRVLPSILLYGRFSSQLFSSQKKMEV